jgi:hypothetical protein
MTEQNSPAVRGPLDATVVPLVACVECGGRLQWRCPACRIAQSAAVADYVPVHDRGPQDTAHTEMMRLLELSAMQAAEIRLLRMALDKIAERTASDDPCRALVQIARNALAAQRCIERRAQRPGRSVTLPLRVRSNTGLGVLVEKHGERR